MHPQRQTEKRAVAVALVLLRVELDTGRTIRQEKAPHLRGQHRHLKQDPQVTATARAFQVRGNTIESHLPLYAKQHIQTMMSIGIEDGEAAPSPLIDHIRSKRLRPIQMIEESDFCKWTTHAQVATIQLLYSIVIPPT